MNKLHRIHLEAIIVWFVYTIGTKILITSQITVFPVWLAYTTNAVTNFLFCTYFLYIFSHEKFFPFAKEIERKVAKQEKKLLNKFIHYGKIAATIAVSFFGSPVYIALTFRLFWSKHKSKYIIAPALSISGGWLMLSLYRGILTSIFTRAT